MTKIRKWLTALMIEYHWACIRALRRCGCTRAAALHRYRAEQLARYYEVLLGLRDTDDRICA